MTADAIVIRGLRAFGHHGVYDDERAHGQTFILDVTVQLDLRRAGRSDALADTVDYGALAGRLAREVQQTRFQLLEALAEHLARCVLEDRRVQATTVRVLKPEAPLDVEGAIVGVEITRSRS